MKKIILDLLRESKEPISREDLFEYVNRFGTFRKDYFDVTLHRLKKHKRINQIDDKFEYFDPMEYVFSDVYKGVKKLNEAQLKDELIQIKSILLSLYIRYPSILKKVLDLLNESMKYHEFKKLQLEEVFIDVKQ